MLLVPFIFLYKKKTRSIKIGKCTCVTCKGKFDSELTVMVNGKRYCKKCGEEPSKEANLFKSIMDIFTIHWEGNPDDINYGRLGTFLNNLKEKYYLSSSEVYCIMDYMFNYTEVPAKNFVSEQSIYNVLLYYEKAKVFWHEYKQKKVDDKQLKEVLNKKPQVITLTRSNLIKQHELVMERQHPTLPLDVKMEDLMEELGDIDIENYSYDYSDEFKNFENWETVKRYNEKQEKLQALINSNNFSQEAEVIN